MTQEGLELLTGTVAAVIFQNINNGYSVLKVLSPEAGPCTVVGTIPLPVVGERLMVTGHWSSHSSYGKQFEAEFLERLMPETSNEILSYLSSRTVKGIGPRTAAKIVERFGADTLHVMESDPLRLSEVPGISFDKAKNIVEQFRQQAGMRRLIEFLTLHNLPADLAVRLYKLFGDEATDILCEDPYLLTQAEFGAPFGAVDRFAVELGISAEDNKRVEAGLLFELRHNLNGGHSFLPEGKLVAATAQLLSIDAEVAAQGLARLEELEQVVRQRLLQYDVVYLPSLFQAESYICQRLLGLAERKDEREDLEELVDDAAKACGIQYDEQQREAIRCAATSGVLIVTGGPGTGKTTILKGVLELFGQMGIKTLLTAPTGRAAKRLTEVTGEDAATIHRLLEAQVDPQTGDMVFVRDEDRPLQCGAVIVDESSMVDVLLMDSLLRALPERARLILVGDPDQLPPVGPGSPFSDMIRSNAIPTVRLTKIFRQAQQSLIVMNAHRVNHGELPDLRCVTSDFFFMRRRSEEDLVQTITALCKTRLPGKMGIPAEDIQVLSPTRKGGAGTASLNAALQAALNPPSPEKPQIKVGEFFLRLGDRVMQIRNNYDILWRRSDGGGAGAGIYNGDIGTILEIDTQGESVTIQFDDRVAYYDLEQLRELELAYAVTVHKSQGSEYRAVILTAWSGSPYLLTRSILYTAITRARQMLVIVGREDIVAAMTENKRITNRYTGLKLRLEGKADGN